MHGVSIILNARFSNSHFNRRNSPSENITPNNILNPNLMSAIYMYYGSTNYPVLCQRQAIMVPQITQLVSTGVYTDTIPSLEIPSSKRFSTGLRDVLCTTKLTFYALRNVVLLNQFKFYDRVAILKNRKNAIRTRYCREIGRIQLALLAIFYFQLSVLRIEYNFYPFYEQGLGRHIFLATVLFYLCLSWTDYACFYNYCIFLR